MAPCFLGKANIVSRGRKNSIDGGIIFRGGNENKSPSCLVGEVGARYFCRLSNDLL